MQTTRDYVPTIANRMEHALTRMPSAAAKLPASPYEITRYVEDLLTPGEQDACNRATD